MRGYLNTLLESRAQIDALAEKRIEVVDGRGKPSVGAPLAQ